MAISKPSLSASDKQAGGRWLLLSILAWLIISNCGSLPAGKHYEAEQFLIRDANGVVRAFLGLTPSGGVGFYLADKKGSMRIEVSSDEAETSMSFMDAKERMPLALRVSEKNGSRLMLAGKDGRIRLHLQNNGNDEPHITIADKGGIRMCIGIDDTGVPHLNIQGSDKALTRLEVDAKNRPHMVLRDSDGKTRATLGIHDNESASLQIADRNGAIRHESVVQATGESRIVLYDKTLQSPRIAIGHISLDGTTGLAVFDLNIARVFLALHPDDSSELTIFDKNGKPDVSVPPRN